VGPQLKYEIIIGESLQALKKTAVEKIGKGKIFFFNDIMMTLEKKVRFFK
jgi:hypothetical protein